MNPETCPECNRLRQELSEITEKIFLLEQRLRRAELREDEEQVKAVSGSLTSLVDAQRRLSQEMTEHIGQAHSTRWRVKAIVLSITPESLPELRRLAWGDKIKLTVAPGKSGAMSRYRLKTPIAAIYDKLLGGSLVRVALPPGAVLTESSQPSGTLIGMIGVYWEGRH